MSYDKLKQEVYMNVGGVNEKASEYITDDREVLSLVNYAFERPGAWITRPGTSLYVNTSLVSKINGVFEYQKLTGESYVLTSAGSTLLSYTNTTPSVLRTDMGGGPVDMLTFVNYAWGADGHRHWKSNGPTSTFWQMPLIQGPVNGTSAQGTTGGTSNATLQPGTYYFGAAYVNERGVVGPLPSVPLGNDGDHSTYLRMWGDEVPTLLTNARWILSGLTIPPGYGISKIAVFMKGFNILGGGGASVPTEIQTWQGYSLYSFTLDSGNYKIVFDHFNEGLTHVVDTDLMSRMGSSVAGQGITFWTTFSLMPPLDPPKLITQYNNMLVYSGFSSSPSISRYADVGEPEIIFPENFIETRTNDGDKITGDAVFQGSRIVFKEKSISTQTGFSPDDISQQEITTNYGCLNNRAIVEFENRLLFLDRKGIAEYNGINTTIVSTKMDATFDRMNLAVARELACGVHIKDRSEAWFAIPLDSSTVNNCIVVYDYVVDAFTSYEGVAPSAMAVLKGALAREDVVFGNHTGLLYAFGPSLTSDNGAAITMTIQTKFHKRLGDSTTELFRRFVLNNAVASTQTPVLVDFIPNYGTASSLTVTMGLDDFQSRIEIGLPAKSMSVKISTSSASERVRINGYTIESRYLRST